MRMQILLYFGWYGYFSFVLWCASRHGSLNKCTAASYSSFFSFNQNMSRCLWQCLLKWHWFAQPRNCNCILFHSLWYSRRTWCQNTQTFLVVSAQPRNRNPWCENVSIYRRASPKQIDAPALLIVDCPNMLCYAALLLLLLLLLHIFNLILYELVSPLYLLPRSQGGHWYNCNLNVIVLHEPLLSTISSDHPNCSSPAQC